MNKSVNLLNAITIELNSLEDAYNSIPNEFLNNPTLIHFRNMMELAHSKIITLVKNNMQNAQDMNDPRAKNVNDFQKININYSQLEALGKKDYSEIK